MSDYNGPKLWKVSVTIEAEAEAYVWADDEDEAESIAQQDVEVDTYGSKYASAHEVKLERLLKKADAAKAGERPYDDDWTMRDRPYGDPPEGVGDTLADALAWLERHETAVRAYVELVKAQVPLFPDVAPKPLPCPECGVRYPAEPHTDGCSREPKKEEA